MQMSMIKLKANKHIELTRRGEVVRIVEPGDILLKPKYDDHPLQSPGIIKIWVAGEFFAVYEKDVDALTPEEQELEGLLEI